MNGGRSCWKGRQVSTKLGLLSIACIHLGAWKLSITQGSGGVSAIQRLLKYWSEWKELSELFVILWVSAVQGSEFHCTFSTLLVWWIMVSLVLGCCCWWFVYFYNWKVGTAMFTSHVYMCVLQLCFQLVAHFQALLGGTCIAKHMKANLKSMWSF